MYIRVTPHRGDRSFFDHDVFIDDTLIGVRPYDGTTDVEEIRNEVRRALAEVLRDKLGWKRPEPERKDSL